LSSVKVVQLNPLVLQTLRIIACEWPKPKQHLECIE
jgi:hypothetical protein